MSATKGTCNLELTGRHQHFLQAQDYGPDDIGCWIIEGSTRSSDALDGRQRLRHLLEQLLALYIQSWEPSTVASHFDTSYVARHVELVGCDQYALQALHHGQDDSGRWITYVLLVGTEAFLPSAPKLGVLSTC